MSLKIITKNAYSPRINYRKNSNEKLYLMKSIVMKNFTIILLLLSLLFVGCAGAYKQASFVSSNVHIGMSLPEFKKLAGSRAKLELLSNGNTVYRINDYDPWYGNITDTKFYYFDSNNKLIRIDGGVQRQDRSQIEIINKNGN